MNSNDLAVAADISKNILFSQLRALESGGGVSSDSINSKIIQMSPSSSASLAAMSYSSSSKRKSGGQFDDKGNKAAVDPAFQGKVFEVLLKPFYCNDILN